MSRGVLGQSASCILERGTRDTDAVDQWPPDLLTAELADLVARSTAALGSALVRLVEVQSELRSLIELTPARPLTDDEMRRYHVLAREEHKAHRRYLASRDWYDGVRRRIRQRAARLERQGDGG